MTGICFIAFTDDSQKEDDAIRGEHDHLQAARLWSTALTLCNLPESNSFLFVYIAGSQPVSARCTAVLFISKKALTRICLKCPKSLWNFYGTIHVEPCPPTLYHGNYSPPREIA
jgi:hypothetical protein